MAVTQFAFCAVEGLIPSVYSSNAVVETVTPGGANVATTAASAGGLNVCRIATDTAIYVSFGSAPNAGTDTVRFYVPANGTEYFRVPVGVKAACIAA